MRTPGIDTRLQKFPDGPLWREKTLTQSRRPHAGNPAHASGEKKRDPATGEWLGARLQELDGEAFSVYGIAKDAGGVALIKVPEGSVAARAGLVTGDLLLQINGNGVEKVGQVQRLTEQFDKHPLTLKIVRDQTPRTLTLQP